MSRITTHVLNTSQGRPGQGIKVQLEGRNSGDWHVLGEGVTDQDGRITTLHPAHLQEGQYRLTFHLEDYFKSQNLSCFYPQAQVIFNLDCPNEHYHIPLLLNPYGYTTYRGS